MSQQHASVRCEPNVLYIHGQPVIVLCGSVFYFRIPRALWQDRLNKIKAAGYNCIDVYFPWNYHEVAEGVWDFSGERDVEVFLQLAIDVGLWIVARPGPYICSEWDGGGLPAYLFAHCDIKIRDNDPRYLRYVANWFDRILPLLKPYQINENRHGGIIALQLENELDFFDCDDRAGYMGALRDLALKHKIAVPLIGCAGQGDLAGATGNVPGVMPTGNFYPDRFDPGIEAKISYYRQELEHRHVPLLITETNRDHFHLRRLLSCGAKLVGPYNQVGGTNFGFTNAINNWGEPLAFITSDYNFRSMISPTGAMTEEFFEARLLTRLIEALSEAFALARPLNSSGIAIQTDLTLPEGGPYGLTLHGGGKLIAIPNLSAGPGTIVIQDGELLFPQYSTLTVFPARCPLLLRDVPLQRWNVEGTLIYATAELGYVAVLPDRVVLAFYADKTAEMAFAFPAGVTIKTDGMTIHRQAEVSTCCFDSARMATAHVYFPNGTLLEIVGMDRASALLLDAFDPQGLPVLNQATALYPDQATLETPPHPQVQWSSSPILNIGEELYDEKIICGKHAKHLEEVGILRGYGWYTCHISASANKRIEGFLLHDAADVLSLYVDGVYHGTVTPGGGTAYLPAIELLKSPVAVGVFRRALERAEVNLMVRAEIWGHSNFDDPRLPAIRLHALRGLRGITAVTAQRDVSKNWRFAPVVSAEQAQQLLQPSCDVSHWILVDWANWLTARQPQKGVFRKIVTLSAEANSWTLFFPGLQSLAEVFVNGKSLGVINPHTPYLDVSSEVRPGQIVEVGIYLEKFYRAAGGKLTLFEGISAHDWWIAGSGETELAALALDARSRAATTELPLRLPTGDVRWIYGDLPALKGCWTIRFVGRNVKISAFFNGKLVGRIWLPTEPIRPRMAGGADDVVYLPGPWFKNQDNSLALLVESVKLGEEAEVTSIEFQTAK